MLKRTQFSTALLLSMLTSATQAQNPSARPTPPPEPAVVPIVSVPTGLDLNKNRVADSIDDSVTSARQVLLSRTRDMQRQAAARGVLDEPIKVEFVFSKQITQDQIDTFLAAGGKIEKVFENVSYGWTGILPRFTAIDVSTSMGQTLLGILESQPVQLHLDEATRNGRVRPTVWDYGVKGDGSGSDRITIAILDTGLDGTHTDFAGRMEYWKDWTDDNHPSPQDIGHHGSHVAGIALGSGAGISPTATSLKYTDHGVLVDPGFYPSPIHIPSSVGTISWTSIINWQTGVGVASALGYHIYRDLTGSYYLLKAGSSVNSPFSLVDSFTNNPSYAYMSAAVVNSGATDVAHYAINNTVTYATPGDGYSPLSGVAPECNWAGFKVFEDSGEGYDTDISAAIDDAVAQRDTHNIRVANLSLGISGPGIGVSVPLRNKINTAASNGIVMVISAGNDGDSGSGSNGEVDDPGRAQYAITVAASNDINGLTYYSSHGFNAPGDSNGGDNDRKPDICAPGGSVNESMILSVDSNTGDEDGLPDGQVNDYTNMQGTSMAAPFISGCSALVIDAMQRGGLTWHTSGPEALDDVRRVKMTLLLTATETNTVREPSASGNPALNRGAKDINEGYGEVNTDAAVEGYLIDPLDSDLIRSATFSATNFGRRCWARRVNLVTGKAVNLNLDVPAAADYDVYIYSVIPDVFGNPQILVSSTTAATGADEVLNYNPVATETGWLVIKKVAGSGAWTLSGTVPVSVSGFTLD